MAYDRYRVISFDVLRVLVTTSYGQLLRWLVGRAIIDNEALFVAMKRASPNNT